MWVVVVTETARPSEREHDTTDDAPAWPAVFGVSLGIFTLITTEMLPVGLLTPLSSGLSVTKGTAALMVTVPGLVAAAAAPVVTVLLARLDRRTILTCLIALVSVANVVCALADTFALALAARVFVGVGIGGFWAIAGGIAPRLVAQRHVPRATAIIFAGVSTATVFGVPFGTVLGDLLNWRAAFLAVTGLGLVSFVLLVTLLPPLPARAALRFRDLLTLVGHHPGVRAGVILTLLLVTGHFSAYTFVRPLLTDIAGFLPSVVGLLLLVYGVAGIAGNFLAGTGRDIRHTLFAITTLIVLALCAFALFGSSPVVAIACLAVWGLAYGGVSVSVQTWMLRAAPERTEAATALSVSAFNFSIALGAFVGGAMTDEVAVSGSAWTAVALVACAAVVLLMVRNSLNEDHSLNTKEPS